MEKTRKPFNVKLFYRRTCLIIYDIISIVLASYLAILARYEFHVDTIPQYFMRPIEMFLPVNILLTLLIFYFFRLYSSLWAFAGETELQNIVLSCLLSTLVDGIGMQFLKRQRIRQCRRVIISSTCSFWLPVSLPVDFPIVFSEV